MRKLLLIAGSNPTHSDLSGRYFKSCTSQSQWCRRESRESIGVQCRSLSIMMIMQWLAGGAISQLNEEIERIAGKLERRAVSRWSVSLKPRCFRKRRDNSTKEQVKRLTVLVTRTDCRLSSNESRDIHGDSYISNYGSWRRLLALSGKPFRSIREEAGRRANVSKRRSTSQPVSEAARDDKKRSVTLFRASRDTTRARTSVNANLENVLYSSRRERVRVCTCISTVKIVAWS